MELIKDPYYEVGTIDDITISQSALAKLDPRRGGSPRKFKSFFENKEDKPSTAMLRGSIFHLYAEDKEKFVISEAIKPSDKLGEVADAVVAKYNSLDKQSQDEMMMMIDMHVLSAIKAIGWNKNWGDPALIKGGQPIVTYLVALNNPENEGKIILTAPLKVQIENCIESLTANDYAHQLMFWKDRFSNIDYYKEKDIYWVEYIDGNEIKCKAKLDDLMINHDAKVIHINDLKTTGKSAYDFVPTFMQYHLDIQFNMYKRAVIAEFPEFAHYKFIYRNIVVETQGLFETVVHKWHPDIIGQASYHLDQLFRRFISAKKTNYKMSLEETLGGGEVKHMLAEVVWP